MEASGAAGGSTPDDLNAAWDKLHAANDRLGWFVGRPGQRHGGSWEIYAFDPQEKPHIGRRSRERTAVGQTRGRVHPRDGALSAGDCGGARVPK